MQNFIVPTPSDDVLSNAEQVAQISAPDRLICTHWRGQEKTILVESVALSQNDTTWYEIPETMTVGYTLANILEADIHSNHDLYVRFIEGRENAIEPSHPMLNDATYFLSTWLDYAEKAVVFQSSIRVDVPQDNLNMVG